MQLENKPFYKNIFDVLPGYEIVHDGNKIKKRQYWDIPTKTGEDRGFQYYLEKLDSLLNESVERQMISDVH